MIKINFFQQFLEVFNCNISTVIIIKNLGCDNSPKLNKPLLNNKKTKLIE